MGLFEQYYPQYKGALGANNPILGQANILNSSLQGSELANGQQRGREAIFGSDQAAPDTRAQDSQTQRQGDITARLLAFADEMNKPLDPNDPYVKSILSAVSSQAESGIRGRGLGAEWATRAAMGATANAGYGIQEHRRELGLQALGAAGSNANATANTNRLAGEDQYNVDMNKYKANSDTWKTVGSIGGGLLGALPGIVTLNPMLAAGGASLGSGLGNAAAGGIYQSSVKAPGLSSYGSSRSGYNPYSGG